MKLGILFSGGKDSILATYLASKKEKIACLITLISENKDSYMFHTPNINLTEIQAQALNLPLIQQQTKGKKEAELKDLKIAIKKAITKYKIEGIVTGTVASTYQSSRIQKICNDLNIYCFNPLWQKDQLELLQDLLKSKFKVIISQVAALGFNKDWLGKEINKKSIQDLEILSKKYKINPAGEGGEYESFVLDSPIHKYKIKITKSEKSFSQHSGILKINQVKLIKK